MADNLIGFDGYDVECLQDAAFAMINEPSDSEGGDFRIVLHPDHLTENDKDSFLALSHFLGLKEIPSNLGLAQFTGYGIKFYSGPIILKHEEKIYLQWGAERKSENLEPLRCEITYNGKSWVLIDQEGEEKTFTLDKLTEKRMVDKKPTDVITPILIFADDTGDIFYRVRFKTEEDFGWLKFQTAWNKGKVDTVLEQIGSINRRSFCNIGKLFTGLFSEKSFPQNGIVIPIFGVQIDMDGTYGPQATCYVDCTGIPGYSIDYSKELVATEDIGGISFSNYHTGFKNLQQAIKDGPPSKDKPFYLWVKGQGKAVDTVPIHIIIAKMYPQVQAAIDAQPKLAAASKPVEDDTVVTVESTVVDSPQLPDGSYDTAEVPKQF